MLFSLEEFAARLKDARFKAGLTQAQLGEAVGLSRVTIYNYEGAKQTPKINHIQKMAEALDCDEAWLIGSTNDLTHNAQIMRELFLQGTNNADADNIFVDQSSEVATTTPTKKTNNKTEFTVAGEVPRIGARLSPNGEPMLDNSNEIIHIAFKRSWLKTLGNSKCFKLIEARGDSMEPTIYDTDLVLYDSSQKDIRPGKIYAVAYEGHIYLKKLYLEPGKLVLRSENREYTDIVVELSDDSQQYPIKVLGRVLWWSHAEKT